MTNIQPFCSFNRIPYVWNISDQGIDAALSKLNEMKKIKKIQNTDIICNNKTMATV